MQVGFMNPLFLYSTTFVTETYKARKVLCPLHFKTFVVHTHADSGSTSRSTYFFVTMKKSLLYITEIFHDGRLSITKKIFLSWGVTIFILLICCWNINFFLRSYYRTHTRRERKHAETRASVLVVVASKW